MKFNNEHVFIQKQFKNPRRQAKKQMMRDLGMTGKQFARFVKKQRRAERERQVVR